MAFTPCRVTETSASEPAASNDDGRLTAMRFPDNTPLPAIYAVAADGQETIVPFTLQGGAAVLATTAREFRLRAGGDVTRGLNLYLRHQLKT